MDAIQAVLQQGERVRVAVERNLMPYWMMLAVAGMGFITYGMSDPIYGWGTFFLGTVLLAFIGGAVLSVRYHVTDRRVVRTGYLGTKVLDRRGLKVTREPGAFGETLTLEQGGARFRIRHVRNAAAVEDALRAS